MNGSNRKHEDLELLRGLAAVGVMIYHFNRGFLPPATAPDMIRKLGIAVEPPFVLGIVNGPFMVAIFFVLSSYALTFRLIERPQPRAVAVALLKRFPRLFPLAFLGALFAGILSSAGLMLNRAAAPIVGSDWLARTGGVKMGDGWPPPSIPGAARDGIQLFFSGVSQYNAALWTMRMELIGGMLALVTALVIAGGWRPIRDSLAIVVLGLVGLAIHPLCAICVGTVLMTKYLHYRPLRMGASLAVPLLLVAIGLGSSYWAMEDLLENGAMEPQSERLQWLLHGVAALLTFLGVHGWVAVSRRSWPIGRWLGEISFSTYVLHMPIQASVGCGVILWLGYSASSVCLALLATLVATFALSMLLAAVDKWWVRSLNRMVSGVFARDAVERAKPATRDAP